MEVQPPAGGEQLDSAVDNAVDPVVESVTLPADPRSVGTARRFVRAALRRWKLGADEDVVELLVSELASNALLYARSPFGVTVRRLPDAVRVEVKDDSPAKPQRRSFDMLAGTGRGIGLVADLSRDWGCLPSNGGKVVWFELAAA